LLTARSLVFHLWDLLEKLLCPREPFLELPSKEIELLLSVFDG